MSVSLLKKRWDGSKAKTNKEPGVSVLLPLKGERLYSFLVLFLLLTLTFFPLIVGKNFMPFERFPKWSYALAESSGQPFQIDYPWLNRYKLMPWAENFEPSSIGITWAENLYFAQELKHGRLPLWDPYTGGGVPTFDNGQSRPLNPFRLPFYLCPTTSMYSLTLFLELIFGGIGAFLWLSRREFSPAALTIGTGLFLFNPWVLERLVLTDSAAYFVLPWCLLTLEQAVWGYWPSIGRAVLCFVLMGHCGHPEAFMIMASVAAAVFLFDGKRSEIGHESFSNRVKVTGVVAVLTCMCLAVLWLPLLKLLAIGEIYKKHGRLIPQHSWKSLTTLSSNTFVVPAIGMVFACALFEWKRLPKVWFVLLGTAFLFLFPLPWVANRLSEVLNYMGLPSDYLKWVFWASLSFLAPYGLDAYRALRKGKVIIVFAIGVAMLAVIGWTFMHSGMARDHISAFPAVAFLLLAFGLLGHGVLRTVRGKLSSLVISTIILSPLAFPLSLNKLAWNTIDFKTNSVVEWLKVNRPHARSASIDPGLYFAIPPNLGQAYGIRCVEVTAAIFLNNYWSMFHHPKALLTTVSFDFVSIDALRQMGASVVLLPNGASSSGLKLLIRGTRFSAYSIPGAHGRLYFAERVRHYKPGTNFPTQILSLSQQTDAVAIVEDMSNPVIAAIPEIPFGEGKAAFERDDANDVLVRTECPSEGLLVLRDSWYPGWEAFIDGNKVLILRVNGCFRGVIVPAGGHTVRFVYRPILVYIVGAVSLLATLLVTLFSIREIYEGIARGRSAVPQL